MFSIRYFYKTGYFLGLPHIQDYQDTLGYIVALENVCMTLYSLGYFKTFKI